MQQALYYYDSVNNVEHRLKGPRFSLSFLSNIKSLIKCFHFTSIWDCKEHYAINISYAFISRIACQWLPASPETGVTAVLHSIYSFAKFLRILFIRCDSQHKQFCSVSPGLSWRKKVVKRGQKKWGKTGKWRNLNLL